MKTKFDLTQLKDNSDRTTCTVSVYSISIQIDVQSIASMGMPKNLMLRITSLVKDQHEIKDPHRSYSASTDGTFP